MMTNNTQTKNAISGSFVSQLSPITGVMQWNLVDSDYDFEQEIARSAYADMLHDYDRNARYHEAIRHVIAALIAEGKPVHVLDIGTGTSLLSMMAARAGADSITACEAFTPVAKCAQRIIRANGLEGRICIVSKRSTDMVVGRDMPQRANVLVAELFDTELIGEGALETYRHAAEHLLTPDAILVPCKARLYMQVVESPFLWSHHKFRPFLNNKTGDEQMLSVAARFPTDEMCKCAGSPAVFDIQASQLQVCAAKEVPSNDGRPTIRFLLEKPILFHEFEFSPPASNMQLTNKKRIKKVGGKQIVSRVSGTAHAVIVWWDLEMEPSGTVPPITTAPSWAPTTIFGGTSRWREHWMQGVYFPRCQLDLSINQPFAVDFSHDDVSMWFDISDLSRPFQPSIERPVCTCTAHMAWPRSRLAEINSRIYQQFMWRLTNKLPDLLGPCRGPTALVVLSDASILPLLLADVLAEKEVTIIHLECSPISANLMQSIYCKSLPYSTSCVVKDSVKDLLTYLEKMVVESPSLEIAIMAEPFVISSILPWNSIHFWFLFGQIRCSLPAVHCRLLAPLRLRIWAVAMEFDHLWKIRAPIGIDCEGFDLHQFDDMILSAAENTDAVVEPQPLGEYSGRARSKPEIVLDINLDEAPVFTKHGPVAGPHSKGLFCNGANLNLSHTGSVNAVAFWADWQMSKEEWRTVGGTVSQIEIDQEVDWCRTGPQAGVHLLSVSVGGTLKEHNFDAIRVNSEFNFNTGEPSFSVELKNY